MASEINTQQVEMVLAQVTGATMTQIEAAAGRMERMAAAGQAVTDAQGVTMTPVTMTEIASQLRLRLAAGKPAPVAAPAATPAGYTRIRISAQGRHFDGAVRDARKIGGRYDGQSRTWLVPSTSNYLNAPGAYGWAIIERN